MGLLFPVFASSFVTFLSPAHYFWFGIACVVAGLAVGLASFAIGSATVVAVVKKVSDKLDDLNNQEGDLTRRIEVESHDAVGLWIDRFHTFQGRLRDMVAALGQIAETSRQAGLELSANIAETTVATVQIRRNSEAVLGGTRTLDHQLTAVFRAKEAINASALQTFEAVNRQSQSLMTLATLMESNLEETRKGSETTQQPSAEATRSLEGSKQSLEGLKQVASATRCIQQDGREIQELVQGIQDGAEQISIQGINAAIEAARAGGRDRRTARRRGSPVQDLTRNPPSV